MSQKEIIKKLCESQPDKWFYSYEFVKTWTQDGWLGTSGDRRARELAESGILERKDEGQYTKYRIANFQSSYRPEVLASKAQERLI